jgi:transketolase
MAPASTRLAAEKRRPEANLHRCRAMSATLRRWIVEQSLAANVGHVGSALSVVEIVCALWQGVMRHPGSDRADRDRFILSKGHAALALYAALRGMGRMDEATFQTYCRDGSLLGGHPEHDLPGGDVSTGSLGQGLSVGCGLAQAFRLRRSPAQVFVLLSDAECNEGQVWEAALYAGHHRLDNLHVVVDCNGMQAMGPTAEILDLAPLAAKWQAFGWRADEVDGHDLEELLRCHTPKPQAAPHVVIAHTRLGHGVSFMEDRLEWHYRNLTSELAARALRELEMLA